MELNVTGSEQWVYALTSILLLSALCLIHTFMSLHCAFQLSLYTMVFLIYKAYLWDLFIPLLKVGRKEIKSLVCVYGFLIYA